MRLQNCHILLLADNASVHIIDKNVNLTNVIVYFLPSNTTAHLQPYDVSIDARRNPLIIAETILKL